MKNSNSFFLIFCLSLTVGLLCLYAGFVGYFNGHEQYEARLAQMRLEVHKERLHVAMLDYQLKDFQQAVAQALPKAEQIKMADYEVRNLSTVVRSPASAESIDLSPVYFEKAKKFFNNQNYDAAIAEFNSLIDKFPLSKFGVEARFFVAESYFLKKDYKSSLQTIDMMVTQFPTHDLTGFILLRMGQISELNNQSEEASVIYKTVEKSFKNTELKKQARKLAQSVDF